MDVSFSGVGYTYPSGVEAVKGITLDVPSGQRFAIVGQNGAGKTTLVRHLNGIFQPTVGTVHVGDWATTGHTIAELSARVGYVFQNPDEQLFARKVIDDVAFGPKNLGFDDERAAALVAAALEQTGLSAEAESHPHHLSLSERKRVALAAVLAMDTPVVVLDEPTTGQDEHGVRMIASIVASLQEQGRTVIAITHDMDFCAENFDRVVAMAHGEVLADGTPTEVFAKDDVLTEARVEAPQLARLADALHWDRRPLTVDAFVEQLPRSGA
ncbi:energy-coupling factor transport system ATP-binding protein [Cryobacterium mesophilum]|uniref:ABC transporter ATP-binding protein n=1 Tax=Terrimesophilobacter mesophilus TaxID=433647 RepID=A0A4R8VCE3_9MICO|nr:ABC transporter ATP-binding protein [Terrimesophilobacter mesophilus]MBB5632690.1 energy-coupling factor transport system ATP-binding protein [Terrimesophilobacter mesophilus]TFB79497.1 ABC transporter ATP-binding protein [Terrimesophilobacter mesophilus]